MTARVDIFNMALGYLGVSNPVSDPNENNPMAGACRVFYDQARQSELRMFPWAFATAAVALALVTDTDRLGYGFVYQRPGDALRIYGVVPVTGARTWLSASRDAWESGGASLPQTPYQDVGGQILTDLDAAYVIYVKDVTEAQMTDPLFVDALALNLAVRIAPRVMGTQAGQAASDRLVRMLGSARSEAWAQALNEQGQDYRPDPVAVQARY